MALPDRTAPPAEGGLPALPHITKRHSPAHPTAAPAPPLTVQFDENKPAEAKLIPRFFNW